MVKNKNPRYYAVRTGRKPGVYHSWAECQAQVSGYSRAEFKAFSTQQSATDWLASTSAKIASPIATATTTTTTMKCQSKVTRYYAVAIGRAPGIYTDYRPVHASCSGFKGAKMPSARRAWEYQWSRA